MIFYKVIKNDKIVDIGSSFYRWNSDYNQVFVSSIENANFAGSLQDGKYYHDFCFLL